MSFPSFSAFAFPFRRARPLTHERFESFVGQLQNTKGKGYLVADQGEVLVGTQRSGHRSWNKAAVKQLTAYLQAHMGTRYEQKAATKALTALQGIKSAKDFDIGQLAANFDGLVDTQVLKPELAAMRLGILKATNGIWETIDQLPERGDTVAPSPANPVASAAQPGQRARQATQAMEACCQRFSEACLPGEQQSWPVEAQRFADWLNQQLRTTTVTLASSSDTLREDLDYSHLEVLEADGALSALLDHADDRGRDPGFHGNVVKACDRLMRAKARYLYQLAFVSNVLATRLDLSQVPCSFRQPLLDFAQSLADLAQALQKPDSLLASMHHRAVEAKASSARSLAHLTGPAAPARSMAEIQQETDARAADAKAAYADFEAACSMRPGEQRKMSADQQRLRAWLQQGLQAHEATGRFPLSAVQENLFNGVPGRIRELHAQREALVRQLSEAGEPNKALLSRIQALGEELDQTITAYLAQLTVLSDRLLAGFPGAPLPADLEAARLKAGKRLQDMIRLLRDPHGELMQIQQQAQKSRDDAQRDLQLAPAQKPGVHPSGRVPEGAHRSTAAPVAVEPLAQPASPAALRKNAARAVDTQWQTFVQKCLTPPNGLSGLSAHQRRVKDWWVASFSPRSDLSRLPAHEFAGLFLTAWPQHLEQVRQRLKDLLAARGEAINPALQAQIAETSEELRGALAQYAAQTKAVGQRLAQLEGFPLGQVPAGFALAAREAGESLLKLHELLWSPQGPMAQAEQLAQQAQSLTTAPARPADSSQRANLLAPQRRKVPAEQANADANGRLPLEGQPEAVAPRALKPLPAVVQGEFDAIVPADLEQRMDSVAAVPRTANIGADVEMARVSRPQPRPASDDPILRELAEIEQRQLEKLGSDEHLTSLINSGGHDLDAWMAETDASPRAPSSLPSPTAAELDELISKTAIRQRRMPKTKETSRLNPDVQREMDGLLAQLEASKMQSVAATKGVGTLEDGEEMRRFKADLDKEMQGE